MPLIRKIGEFYISRKEPTTHTGPGTKGPTEIPKKRYELELEKHLDMSYTLGDNIKNIYSILWGQSTEALQQGLCRIEYFE